MGGEGERAQRSVGAQKLEARTRPGKEKSPSDMEAVPNQESQKKQGERKIDIEVGKNDARVSKDHSTKVKRVQKPGALNGPPTFLKTQGVSTQKGRSRIGLNLKGKWLPGQEQGE